MAQRLIACQGPIQLVTAVAVLRQRDRERSDAREDAWQDHLAILELAAPSAQEKVLVDALTRMARALRRWRSVVHVTDAELEALRPESLRALDDVRELYVVREWQRGNEVLLGLFRDAQKICFGDSIGIYLAPSYMAPAPGFARGVMRFLRSSLRSGRRADRYYLALPRAFDRAPSRNVTLTDLALLREALDDLRPLLPGGIVAEIRRRAAGAALTVLVGSNFSEQGAMSMEAEISAYLDYLREHAPAGHSLVVLKPHPRDRREKTAALEGALRGLFADVLTLSDEAGLYLPLEALLLELRSGEPRPSEVVLCTFSSACLAPRHLLGLAPRIGFGERLVRSHFYKPYVPSRLRHEAQLVSACG